MRVVSEVRKCKDVKIEVYGKSNSAWQSRVSEKGEEGAGPRSCVREFFRVSRVSILRGVVMRVAICIVLACVSGVIAGKESEKSGITSGMRVAT